MSDIYIAKERIKTSCSQNSEDNKILDKGVSFEIDHLDFSDYVIIKPIFQDGDKCYTAQVSTGVLRDIFIKVVI